MADEHDNKYFDVDVDALIKHFRSCDRKTQLEILDGTSKAHIKTMNLHFKLMSIYAGCA